MSKQRWKDSLIDVPVCDPEKHMRRAISYLADAIMAPVWYSQDPSVRRDYERRALAYAGAHIRAARKGLGVESQRIGDFYSEDAALLTSALRDVTEALDAHRFADGAEAHSLRCAEAALRTMWKRAQS